MVSARDSVVAADAELPATGTLALAGSGGEPVDLARTLASHGVATLPPQLVDPAAGMLETTLSLGAGPARTIRIRPGDPGRVAVAAVGGDVPSATGSQLLATARKLLNLDQDLSRFYTLAATDDALAWVTSGAGEAFYRDQARAGYRGRYLLRLAADVADGVLDLEQLRDPDPRLLDRADLCQADRAHGIRDKH